MTDDGCGWFPRCLECPLPLCRFDVTPAEAERMRRRQWEDALYQRYLELITLPSEEMAAQVGREFGRAGRTVYAIINRVRCRANGGSNERAP